MVGKKSRKPTRSLLSVDDIEVEVVRKDVRYLRIAVIPPEGRVRISVPRRVGDAEVRTAVSERLQWIAKQQQRMRTVPRPLPLMMATGDRVMVAGTERTLVVTNNGRCPGIELSADWLHLYVADDVSLDQRYAVLDDWYRAQLGQALPLLLARWEPIIGVQASRLTIRKMTTRWGSCNCRTARLTFNLELAKKPPELLEYVVVHELTHLLERGHGPKFQALMDRFLPDWRQRRRSLNG